MGTSASEEKENMDTEAMEVTPEEEILEKLSSLSMVDEDESVSVAFTKKDVDIWKDFTEYRKNRRKWDTWREEDWHKHHPPHVHSLFNNWPPVLETPRLRLRLLSETDTESVFRVLSNPTTMKYYGTAAHKNIEYTQKQYIDLMLTRFKYRDAASFVITFQENDDYIGHINAIQFDRVFKFVEIAYIIDPEHWGKGIATEAVGRVVEFLQKDVKIHKIRASLYSKNIASKRVLEKLGFIQEGYLRDNVIIDGEFVDEYLMALISEENGIDEIPMEKDVSAADGMGKTEHTSEDKH
jgi:[ribosomal protein S5]-alanine N-acetyltransferase